MPGTYRVASTQLSVSWEASLPIVLLSNVKWQAFAPPSTPTLPPAAGVTHVAPRHWTPNCTLMTSPYRSRTSCTSMAEEAFNPYLIRTILSTVGSDTIDQCFTQYCPTPGAGMTIASVPRPTPHL